MTTAAPRHRPIRVIIDGLHAKSGGGLTYLRNLLPILAQDSRFELHLFLHEDQFHLFHPVAEPIRVHLFGFKSGFWRLLAWEQVVLPIVARLMAADVTFSPANYGPLLAPNLVILLRNTLAVVGSEKRVSRHLYWVGLAIMTAVSLVRAKKAIAVSRYAANTLSFGLAAVGVSGIEIIYHGVNDRFRQAPAPMDSPPFLLAVSDIYVQKNLHTLIDALVKVRERHPDVRLKIAGREVDHEYTQEITARIARYGIADQVDFLGTLSVSELVDLYRRCAVFVFPSIAETFGNPLVEAMACGAPIACSNTAAMPEILADGGLYFSPTVDDMAEKIVSILENPDLRNDLSARALARARTFSWPETGRLTAEILVSACPSPGKGGRAR